MPPSREKSAVSPGTAQSGRRIWRKYRAVCAYRNVPPDNMTFENELARKIQSALSVKKTSMKNVARGIENMRPSVHTTLNESTRLDENNVDMDQEQVELARTAYEYQFMISSVSSDLSRLRSAAKNF